MKEETLLHKEVNIGDVDGNNRLSLSSILSYAQEAAIYAVEKDLGITREMTNEKGLLWVLARYRFEITRLPKLGEEISLLTWQSQTIAFFFIRNFEILDKEGNILVKGTSCWALINKDNRQIIIPKDYGITINSHIRGDELPRPKKIEIQKEGTKTILRCNKEDLDSNLHMNNIVYMDKCLSLIPKGYLNTHYPKSIDINYKKELRLNEETELWSDIKEDRCSFSSDAFDLAIDFEKSL